MKYSIEAIYQAMSMCGFEAYQAEKLVSVLRQIMPDTGREYAVMTTQSRQISEDHYQVYHPTVKVTDNTTIGEVRKWYLSLYSTPLKEEILMDDISIIEMKQI